MREIYGTHVCDASKIITDAQLNPDGTPINDCLGHPNGSVVDNIEDVDTIVGWLAEYTRPHGFAISETQFVVFILNASRRLFSDRFFTSSFRPEFYSTLGVDWVNNNGPGPVHDGDGHAQRARAAGVAAETRADAQHSRADAGAAARGQRLRSLGARSRPVLFAGMEASARMQHPTRRSSNRSMRPQATFDLSSRAKRGICSPLPGKMSVLRRPARPLDDRPAPAMISPHSGPNMDSLLNDILASYDDQAPLDQASTIPASWYTHRASRA